ncbi:hypothetical protein CSC94_22755 [Zhengella mangrovi]|uniref:DUF4396 domain-containing protein n=1 Tax=Zhengella mangrovi TaxID=1982044 RepID=A0A2G1QGW3_9HYPH|nr:DUF4396 domain-containing protein [Zhengella mangrovi]PHP64755.1 hypothetical protein CSC94_22755 [Zhengella mangrovi]
MLDGIMLLWFLLTAMSVLFVAVDIRSTPEATVMKWGFILLTAYTGPIGAFLYVLGCREPLPGLHEQYTAIHWRQALGSTMHCVAGDGIGILAGAVVAPYLSLGHLADIAVEYVLGFGFGWTIFQALFMQQMSGGSYTRSLAATFMPEFLSMNFLMSGMIVAHAIGAMLVGAPLEPATPEFWFVMSMALLAGFVVAYPVNAWMVARHMKHGMMTVRPAGRPADRPHAPHADHTNGAGDRTMPQPSPAAIRIVAVLSLAALGAAVAVSMLLAHTV